MAKLRKFQFLRNSSIAGPFESYVSARTAAETAFANITDLQDGEIALYSYKLGTKNEDGSLTPIDTVHTLLGIKREGGIEILGNYDELTAEYKSYVASEIAKLDSEKTDTNNGVSVTVKQVDGKIDSVSVVAPSLTSAIEALDVDPFSLTTLNGDKLEGYQISEVDGKIVKGQTAETLLTFASAPTASNKVATQAEINALYADVTSAINGLDSNAENENGDIKVKVSQVDGKLSAVEVTDTLAAVAHSGKAADVTITDTAKLFTATNVEAALAEVMTKANELDAAQLSAGNGISITDKKINSDFTVTIENLPESEGVTAGTYIVIKGNGENGQEITKVNANSFVKDGFLQKVEKDAENNTLKFTWNTDAGIEVTTISISDLCDVYTADETYLHLNGYKFEHKTSGVTAGEYGADADVTVNSTTSKSFIVPTLTVDAAGHVTAASEKTVTISLPASINTAVQTINGHTINDSFITTTVTPSNNNTTQTIAVTAQIGSVANNTAGLAEATEVRDYVDSKIQALDDSMTTVTDGVGISVKDRAAENSNDHEYIVSLAEAPATVTNDTDDYVAANGTHTRISDIIVDDYGRVTAVTKTTVTENFDAGTY